MSTHRESTSTYCPEFTLTHEPHRRRWVILQHGTVYQVIPAGRRYPAHNETYIRRILDILNQETT